MGQEKEHINVQLSVNGTPIEMGMNVPVNSVKLRRMLPLIRQMSNSFIDVSEKNIRESGKAISCTEGCAACCRHLVPISEAEAFDLRDLIEAMPEPRKTEIISRFQAGVERLNAAGFFERFNIASLKSDENYAEMLKEYFRFWIACPFLENECCSIRESRPITCREYLVTSPSELCASAEGTGVENVLQYFQIKEALISTAQNKTPDELPYVPLIHLIDWTDKVKDDSPQRTGREWVKLLFDFLVRFNTPETPK